ncbi:NPCBM/NEW2 domain-containing protein [Thalassoroseus pseudoceratinae]|uniref:NPCBM/NEW2 domain-containing protein n=1 Tax=Thalassoroseus pseudoceratinae TaxID=2713176 RepID=UPI0014240C45|nr:NPCBM/NEW2 domain-containing protein [Thalassoroseus pseudoceratinae]
MKFQSWHRRVWGILAFLMLDPMAFAAETRYVAELADRTRVSDEIIHEWHEAQTNPHLAGKRIFDEKLPFRWLMNVAAPLPSTNGPSVEFSGGDRLPGKVVGFRKRESSPYFQWVDHLLVEPTTEVDHPQQSRYGAIRVAVMDVRRVTWEPIANREFQPGNVFLRDGRQFGFRSLRWSDGAVTLLTANGLEQFRFGEIAEIHVPPQDPWDAYVESLTKLVTTRDSRLLRLETTDGLRVTTSTERFEAGHYGDKKKRESWLQRLQPAWSLDPFWVRFPTIRSWLFFQPHEVPVSLIAPVAVEQKSTFGTGLRWQTDRSVHAETLRSADEEYPAGFGVHAKNSLTFALPAAATAFRSQFGLDQSTGKGGCVRVRVFIDTQSKPLYESDLLIGSEKVLETGELKLPIVENRPDRQLTLTVDPVLTGRPAGADPFDIRDSLNWLSPTLTLDADRLWQDIQQRSLDAMPVLADWESSETRENVRLFSFWDETIENDPRYRIAMAIDSSYTVFSRTLTFDPEDRWLSIAVSQIAAKVPDSRLVVLFNKQVVGDWNPPVMRRHLDPQALAIPLHEWQGRPVHVELVQWVPTDDDGQPKPPEVRSAIDWRGIGVLPHHPGLINLFDEEANFVDSLNYGTGMASIVTDDAYSGQRCLRVTPPGRGSLDLTERPLPIRFNPRLGEFQLLHFAWKKDGGRTIGLEVAHDGEIGADPDMPRLQNRRARDWGDLTGLTAIDRGMKTGYRYYSGIPVEPFKKAKRLDSKLSPEWKSKTVHIVNDFGEFSLTGFHFSCPDGNAAWLDSVYLTRTYEDLNDYREWIKKTQTPVKDDARVLVETYRRQEYPYAVSQVAPEFVVDRSGSGCSLFREHAGRQNVLRTSPYKDKPSVFRAAVTIPEGHSPKLKLGVSHDHRSDWKLRVLANDEQIHEEIIGGTDEPSWKDLTFDLSKFAGQQVRLDIHNVGNGGNDSAFWSEIKIVK